MRKEREEGAGKKKKSGEESMAKCWALNLEFFVSFIDASKGIHKCLHRP